MQTHDLIGSKIRDMSNEYVVTDHSLIGPFKTSVAPYKMG